MGQFAFFDLVRAKPSARQVLSVIWGSEMNDSHGPCSLDVPGGGCTTNIRTRGGGWERQVRPQEAGGIQGWWLMGRPAPLRPWHLVARHEQTETNHANLTCRDLVGRGGGGAASVVGQA